MVIYLDVLMIVNFIIAYFLLLATAVLSGYTYSRKRIIVAALLGALASLIIFLDIKSLVLNLTIKSLLLIVCVVVAFGFSKIKKLVTQGAYYIFFNMLLTGMVILAAKKTSVIYQNNTYFYFNINPVSLVVFSLIIYGIITLCQLIKEKISVAETMEATFSVEKDVYIKVQAFYDTGFALKDVINNKDIILVDYKKVKDSLSENLRGTLERYFLKGITQTDEKVTPIFFSTISGDGSLPGIKALDVKINNKSIDNVMLAFSQNALTENVNAIFGSDIKKRL